MSNEISSVVDSIKNLEKTVALLQKDLDSVKLEKSDNRIFMLIMNENLDNILPAFIIAAAAQAMNVNVSMFFTFKGLSVVRKDRKLSNKTITEKMFSLMTARSMKELPLSKNNMWGIGPKFLKLIMKQHNVVSFEDLFEICASSSVKMIACQMTMGIMGITKDELMDHLQYAGAGYAINEAMHSKIALTF